MSPSGTLSEFIPKLPGKLQADNPSFHSLERSGWLCSQVCGDETVLTGSSRSQYSSTPLWTLPNDLNSAVQNFQEKGGHALGHLSLLQFGIHDPPNGPRQTTSVLGWNLMLPFLMVLATLMPSWTTGLLTLA